MSETNKVNKSTGLSTAGLVLGIVGVVLSFIPIINNLAFFLGILAIIFGIIGLVKKHGGKALAALILGVLSIIITLAIQSAASKALETVSDSLNENFGVDSTNQDGSASVFADSAGLELVEEPKLDLSSITSYGGTAKVTGTIINNSDKTYNSPNVKFIATDAEGNALDACLAYSSATLAPGQKWNFEATCGWDQKPASIQLDQISHF